MKILECTICGVEGKVSADAVAYMCHTCINESLQPDNIPTKKRVGFPKGWRFMKQFVHADGTVYFKGVEQPSLKGTLEATKIVEKVKVSKKEKEQQKMSLLEEYSQLKKKLKIEKRKTTRKKIEARLNKISKLI